MKDIAIGSGVVLAVAIIYAGAFNSYSCWSNRLNGVFRHSLYVALRTDSQLQANAEDLYPGLVGGGLGAQTFLNVAITCDSLKLGDPPLNLVG